MAKFFSENSAGIICFLVMSPFAMSALYLKKIYQHQIPPKVRIGAFSILAYSSIHLFSWVFAKRVAFSIFFAFLLFRYRESLFRFLMIARTKSYNFKLLAFMVGFISLVKIIPGGYAPPFWGGIAGWTFKSDFSNSVQLSGIELVNSSSEVQWLSNGFTIPQSFMYRQYLHFQDSHRTLKIYLDYLWTLYVQSWSLTERGLFQYQRYLGPYALPGHMPGRMLDYSHFHPTTVTHIRHVTKTWNKSTKSLAETKVHFSYNIGSKELEVHR